MSPDPFLIPGGIAWTPACMAPDEYQAWAEMNGRLTHGTSIASRPCADCTLGYAAEMRAVGRCNGTPAGVEEDPDMDPVPRQAAEPRPLRRVPVAVTPPPCASCVHEPVCALRQTVEGLADIPVAAPTVPDGLTIELVAAVECSHFLRDRAKPAPLRAAGASQTARRWNDDDPFGKPKRQISDETRAKMSASARAAIERRKAAGA